MAYQLMAGSRDLVIRETLVGLAAAVLWLAVRAVGAARPTRAADPLPALLRSAAGPQTLVPESLRAAQRDVYFGIASAADLNFRLRPRLRELARHKLRLRSGIELEREPERAEMAVGPELWQLIRPLEPNPERQGPGVSFDVLERAIKTLERL